MNLYRMCRGLCSVLFVTCLATSLHAQTVVVNEFLASNAATNVDEDGVASDWIELYNTGAAAVNLNGFTITDNATLPAQWAFPSVTIDPGGFLLVWASANNRTGNQLHTNFKLSASGEFIGLYTPGGVLVDGLTFGAQTTDVSMARIPNGVGSFQSTTSPTPGARNQGGGPVGDPLAISPPSKLFSGTLTINLSTGVQGAEIRYTLGGSSVSASSQLYTGPIAISSTKALRARAYKDGAPVSEDVSQFYLKNYPGHIPVLSLATDRSNLYGDRGIFDNWDKEGDTWERPVSVNLLELDGTGFQINGGVRVHGEYSRRFPKKSMRVHFRSDYGKSRLDYKVFSQKDLQSYKALVVHSGGSYDQYYENEKWTMLRDPLSHALWLEKGGAVSAFRPVVLYINGELWGIYHIRERVNDDYVKDNFGVSTPDLLEWSGNSVIPEIKDGDLVEWNKTYSFFKNSSLSSSSKYEEAKRLIDIDNFIDYNIIEIFAGNRDWPHNNEFFFRDRVSGAKWRWILWDAEITFHNPDFRSLEWATRDRVRTDIMSNDNANQLYGTLLLRKLMENSDFRELFINRFADFMNTSLGSGHVGSVFDQIAAGIQADIPIEANRWGVPVSQWNDGVAQIRNFISKRTNSQKNQIISYFGLGGKTVLTANVSSSAAGKIRVNSLTISNLPWSGTYFTGNPVTLEALPNPGFKFVSWSGASVPSNALVRVNLSGNPTITANFAPTAPPQSPIITSFTPTSGPVGTVVTISGSGFTNTSAVKFNGLAAAFTFQSDSRLLATTPTGATTGKISVTTPEGTAQSASDFTVTTGGGSNTVSFTPRHDTFVKSSSTTTNYGTGKTMRQRKTSTETITSYLKFDVSGLAGPAQSAKLRLFVTDASSDGGAVYVVSNNYLGTSTAWTQTGLNWNNAPAISGTALSSVGAVAVGNWVEFNVTSAITGNGTYSFGLKNNSSDVVQYNTKEATNKPELVIQGVFTTLASTADREIVEELPLLPEDFGLYQNYPNPFNPETRIEFDLPQTSAVRLTIYNVLGREVVRLVDEERPAGRHSLVWNSRDENGARVSSGIYFYSLQAGEFRASKKMLLVQ